MTVNSGKISATKAPLDTCTIRATKTLLVVTDLGLLTYWILTAIGVVSVGKNDVLLAWNWSFLPLDLLAVTAGLAWSLLPTGHRWSASLLLIALALTFTAGLMAISFFALWGSWDPSWWLVNLWLALMPGCLAPAAIRHVSTTSH
jgi:hypothetical protein